MAKVYHTKETQDNVTGEILKVEIYRKHTDNAEQFARVFFQDLSILAKCNGSEKGVVLACLQYLSYNTNQFLLSPDRRDEICLYADIAPQTVSHAISALCKTNVFIKKRGSTYILNPNILFYGDEKERKKVIEATSEYKLGGGMQKPNPISKKFKK